MKRDRLPLKVMDSRVQNNRSVVGLGTMQTPASEYGINSKVSLEPEKEPRNDD